MGKTSEKLRRQKLWWCAENNKDMQVYNNAPAQYLISNMPKFCKVFSNDMERASDNLQQYLGSEKTDYWNSRPEYIEELCTAIYLPIDIWNLSDFDQFRDAARIEYRRLGILSEAASEQYESMYSLMPRLHTLKTIDGKSAISFDVDELSPVLGFRRKLDTPKSQEFYEDDSVRIHFQPEQGSYALLFLIDPVNNCQMVAPTSYQNDTIITDGVFHVPALSDDKIYPPEKKGWHQLYGLGSAEQLTEAFKNTDGEKPLTPQEFEALLKFCVEAIAGGAVLHRLDFYVKGRK